MDRLKVSAGESEMIAAYMLTLVVSRIDRPQSVNEALSGAKPFSSVSVWFDRLTSNAYKEDDYEGYGQPRRLYILTHPPSR